LKSYTRHMVVLHSHCWLSLVQVDLGPDAEEAVLTWSQTLKWTRNRARSREAAGSSHASHTDPHGNTHTRHGRTQRYSLTCTGIVHADQTKRKNTNKIKSREGGPDPVQ
jgi:hypothetical protein